MDDWISHAASHPRPDRVRPDTIVLDGDWDFALDRLNAGRALGWPGRTRWSGRKVRVPFCVESELSGIARRPAPWR